MNRKSIWKILIPAALILIVIAGIVSVLGNQHVRIDEWSSALVPEKIDWAEAGQGYGAEKISYSLTEADYGELVPLLALVTEENSSREFPDGVDRMDYRLAVHYDGQLWLFHCYTNELVSVTFDTPETAAYYGCESSPLVVESPALWQYIVNTVDNKAE